MGAVEPVQKRRVVRLWACLGWVPVEIPSYWCVGKGLGGPGWLMLLYVELNCNIISSMPGILSAWIPPRLILFLYGNTPSYARTSDARMKSHTVVTSDQHPRPIEGARPRLSRSRCGEESGGSRSINRSCGCGSNSRRACPGPQAHLEQVERVADEDACRAAHVAGPEVGGHFAEWQGRRD